MSSEVLTLPIIYHRESQGHIEVTQGYDIPLLCEAQAVIPPIALSSSPIDSIVMHRMLCFSACVVQVCRQFLHGNYGNPGSTGAICDTRGR